MTAHSGHTLEMVTAPAITTVWNDFGVGALFAAEEDRGGGDWSAQTLLDDLENGRSQLWLVLKDRKEIHAALITALGLHPTGSKSCNVLMIVGERTRSWIGLVEVLENWARDNGCKKIEATGRIGWKRVLRDWKPSAMIFEKAL